MIGLLTARLVFVLLHSLLTMLVLISGCSNTGQTIDVTKLGPAREIVVYQGGKPIIERSIAAGSDEELAVTAWLQTHKSGWRWDLNTYAPVCRVSGERFTLNFQMGRCILNYRLKENGNFSQVSRPLKDDEAIPEIFDLERKQ